MAKQIDKVTRYTVHGVLAGAYKGRDIGARALLNHASQDGSETSVCKRIRDFRLCDEVEGAAVAVTCPECLARIERRGLVRARSEAEVLEVLEVARAAEGVAVEAARNENAASIARGWAAADRTNALLRELRELRGE